MSFPKVYIIILNYNNFSDTLECLESVFDLNYFNFSVIVCDNGSTDRSIESIQAWAEGRYPIILCQNENDFPTHQYSRLIIIKNKANLGYGGGNNSGIRWALKDPRLEYIWILNNDTIVEKNSLNYLIEKISSDQKLSACGSTILYYHDPSIVQALGGFSYSPWTGKSRQFGHLKPWSSFTAGKSLEIDIEKKMYWIQGASIFLRKTFIEKVGLISEDYFLYFEEQDWGIRSRKMFKTGYASKSIIYHKEGRTTGSESFSKNIKSLLSEFYLSRSRLVFTKKYYPLFLPLIQASHFYISIRRLLCGQWRNALVIFLCSIFVMKEKINLEKVGNPYEDFLLWIKRKKILTRFQRIFINGNKPQIPR